MGSWTAMVSLGVVVGSAVWVLLATSKGSPPIVIVTVPTLAAGLLLLAVRQGRSSGRLVFHHYCAPGVMGVVGLTVVAGAPVLTTLDLCTGRAVRRSGSRTIGLPPRRLLFRDGCESWGSVFVEHARRCRKAPSTAPVRSRLVPLPVRGRSSHCWDERTWRHDVPVGTVLRRMAGPEPATARPGISRQGSLTRTQFSLRRGCGARGRGVGTMTSGPRTSRARRS